MNIRFLETFIWVTRLKSFRAAAEKLNTTQPNISSRISALEDHLRVKLYERSVKEFRLTAAGRRLLEHATQIVDLWNKSQEELPVADDGHSIIRVGIIEMVTVSWLPQFVHAVRAAQTMPEVDFITETSISLTRSLRKNEIDVAFIWGPANEPGITNEYICDYTMAWLGAPGFCAGRQTMDVVDLARLPVIPTKKEASGHVVVKEYFAAYGVDGGPRSKDGVTLSSYSLATAIQLIRTGLGVMAVPPLVLADDLRAGIVATLPVKQALPPIHLTACYQTLGARPSVVRLIGLARQAAAEYAALVDPAYFRI